MARRRIACRREDYGSILILTVWTLFFLAALAVAVGSYVSGGLTLARRASTEAHGRAAVMAGVAHMTAVLESDTNQWDGFAEDWGHGGNIDWEAQRLGDSIYRIYNVTSGGETNAGLVDEESRLNINKADQGQLESLFRRAGGADSIAAASLAAAVIDWRDPDDDISPGGVESGYYGGVGNGYSCANADFQTVYELMLLRGMTDEIYDRVKTLVTVYGAGKVNINTADPVVLSIIAESVGADESLASDIADRIAVFRSGGGSFSQASATDIASAVKETGMLGVEGESILMKMMVSLTLEGTCFRGVVEGFRDTDAGGPAAEFVYDRDYGKILFWNEL